MSSSFHPTLARLLGRLSADPQGAWSAAYRNMRLTSVFQPVLSITHRRIVGHEALVRARVSHDTMLEPEALFALAQAYHDAPFADRLTRCLHMANFAAQDPGHGWLFLNVMPQMLDSGSAQPESIDALCAHFHVSPSRIVLEVIEQPVRDEAELARTIDRIQHRDFLIAIDDFGTGFSNFDRVWQARPDIVKLDRSLIERSQQPGDARRHIRHLVTMLHQAGAMVLAEGIETDDALQIAIDADIDFVQGFLFGRPNAWIADDGHGVGMPAPHAGAGAAAQTAPAPAALTASHPAMDAACPPHARGAETAAPAQRLAANGLRGNKHESALAAAPAPATAAQRAATAAAPIEAAWQQRAARHTAHASGLPASFDEIERHVLAMAHAYLASRNLAGAAATLFDTHRAALRVFTTDATGEQAAPSIARTDTPPRAQASRLAPLFPDDHCNRSRLSAWQRAVAGPGRVVVTGPHYSLLDGCDIWTAAVALPLGDDTVVICADFLDAPPPAGEASTHPMH